MAEYYIQKGINQYQIVGGDLTLQDGNAIDAGTLQVSVAAQPYLLSGDDVNILSTENNISTIIFAGKISRPMDSNGFLQLDIESYSTALNKVHALEIYNNVSPEYIVQDLITKYTPTLTYASSTTSGIIIKQFRVDDSGTILSFIQKLLDILGSWQLRGDYNKNIYFEPKTISNSGLTFTIGDNCYIIDAWDRNPDTVVNKLILVGANQTFTTQIDSFTASGGQTTKALSYLPTANFRITDNGTELVGGLDSNTSNPAYTVNVDNLLVTFTSPLVAGHTIVISYSYQVPVKLTADGPTDSIQQYGPREQKENISTILNMSDARKFAESYFVERAYPLISNKIYVADNIIITQGQMLQVIDTFSNIDSLLQCQAKKYNFSEGTLTLTVGTKPFTNYHLQKDIQSRLAALEQAQNNSSLLQKYDNHIENLNVSLESITYNYELKVYDSWIWGISKWGVDTFGDRREGDNFDQFGSYSITDRWSISGSVSIDTMRMKLDASITPQTALYTAGSSFSISNGKIITHVQKSASTGSVSFKLRYTDSNNYYLITCDFVNNLLKLDLIYLGSSINISSVSKSWSTNGDLLTIRFSGSTINITDSIGLLLDTATSILPTDGIFTESFLNNTYISSASTANIDTTNHQVIF